MTHPTYLVAFFYDLSLSLASSYSKALQSGSNSKRSLQQFAISDSSGRASLRPMRSSFLVSGTQGSVSPLGSRRMTILIRAAEYRFTSVRCLFRIDTSEEAREHGRHVSHAFFYLFSTFFSLARFHFLSPLPLFIYL